MDPQRLLLPMHTTAKPPAELQRTAGAAELLVVADDDSGFAATQPAVFAPALDIALE